MSDEIAAMFRELRPIFHWHPEHLAMLDRIEAEIERLRADRDDLIRSAKEKQERLRESEAEVERLRAELKREQERADMLHSQVLKFEKRIETGGWS